MMRFIQLSFLFVLVSITTICWAQVSNQQASKVKVPEKAPEFAAIPVDDLTSKERDILIKIQYLLRAVSSLKRFSGAVIIAKEGKPLYKFTAGFANLDYMVPNSLTTSYNTCAVTETFTALAIMQLAEQGIIDLNAPISTYLPELPAEVGSKLTIHNLLTHTSGLPDYYQSVNYMQNFLNIKSNADMVNLITSENAPCNTNAHQFTNSGYVFLGSIIDRMSGKNYQNYIVDNIFKPANMLNTAPHFWHQVVDNKAVGYKFDNSLEAAASPDFWGAFPFGADGVYATTEDLLRFCNALDSTALLSNEYKKIMYTDYTVGNSEAQKMTFGYAYGWKTRKINKKNVLFQGGYIDGVSVQLRRYIDDKYTVIVCSNYNVNIAADLADRIEQTLYDESYFIPSEPTAFVVNDLIQREGLVTVINNFDKMLEDNRTKLENVWTLNSLGNEYMKDNNWQASLEILKLNSQRFPKEPIVWDSLGEYYFRKKEYKKSAEYFIRKLEVSPNDKRAKGMISFMQKTQ